MNNHQQQQCHDSRSPRSRAATRWFEEGELRCHGPGCTKPMPAGFYGKDKWLYLCSTQCRYGYQATFRPMVKCDCGCGTKFHKKSYRKQGMSFVNVEHFARWRNQELDRKKVRKFTPLLHEFMDTCAPKQYAPTTLNKVRCTLAAFFGFLNGRRIRSLESVKPQTITAFLTGLMKTRKKSAASDIATVRRLFDWLILTDRRHSPNPVIPSFHSQKRPLRLPRPYEPAEMELIWRLLDEADDLVLKLAVSLGEESGARISEVSNIRVEDVNLTEQQVFIRLPNKVGIERYAPFHDRTKALLEQWLKRRPACNHDHLLVAQRGGPLRKHRLRERLNELLVGPGKLPTFSFHRLRARAATRVARGGAEMGAVMNLFGWRNPAVAAQYVKYLPENLRVEYARCMQEKSEKGPAEPRTVSLDEFFANRSKQPAEPA